MKKIFAIAAVAALTLGSSAYAQTPSEVPPPIDVPSTASVYVPLTFSLYSGDLHYGPINPNNLSTATATPGNIYSGPGPVNEIYRQLTFAVGGQTGDNYKISIAPGAGASELPPTVGVSGGIYTNPLSWGGRVIQIDGFTAAPGAIVGNEFYVISFTDKQTQPRFSGLGTVGDSEGNLPGAPAGQHNIAASISGINVPAGMGIDDSKRGTYSGIVVFSAAYD